MEEELPASHLGDLLEELLGHISLFLPAASLIAYEGACHRTAALDTSDAWRGLCIARWEDKPRYRLTPERQRFLDERMRMSWKRRYIHFELDAKRKSITPGELMALGWYFNYTPDAGGLGRQTLKRVRFRERLEVPEYPPLPYALDGPAGLVGRRVTAVGLRGRPDLNGRVGRATELSAATGRYTVIFDGGESLRLFSLNVRLATAAEVEAAAGAPSGSHDWASFDALAATLPGREQTLTIANFPKHEVARLSDSWEWLIYNANVTMVSCDEAGSLSYAERGFNADRDQVIHAAIAAAEAAQQAQGAGAHAEPPMPDALD